MKAWREKGLRWGGGKGRSNLLRQCGRTKAWRERSKAGGADLKEGERKVGGTGEWYEGGGNKGLRKRSARERRKEVRVQGETGRRKA